MPTVAAPTLTLDADIGRRCKSSVMPQTTRQSSGWRRFRLGGCQIVPLAPKHQSRATDHQGRKQPTANDHRPAWGIASRRRTRGPCAHLTGGRSGAVRLDRAGFRSGPVGKEVDSRFELNLSPLKGLGQDQQGAPPHGWKVEHRFRDATQWRPVERAPENAPKVPVEKDQILRDPSPRPPSTHTDGLPRFLPVVLPTGGLVVGGRWLSGRENPQTVAASAGTP